MKKMRHVANTRLPQCKVHPTDIALSTQLNVVVFSTYFALRLLNVFASNDTLFNLLRIYFEHKVHSPQCTFGCKLHSVRCKFALRELELWKIFQSNLCRQIGCLLHTSPTAPPVARSTDGIDISLSVAKLIGLRDLALWFTAPTSSKFKDHDIKTDVTVVACLKNLNVNYVTPGIGLHRALVSIRLCQYGCYICVVFFFSGWTCCWMYWKAWAPRAMHLERVRSPVDITAVRNPCFLRAGFDFEQVSLKVS